MCWQVKLPFLSEVFPGDTSKFPEIFFPWPHYSCAHAEDTEEGAAVSTPADWTTKGEEKELLEGDESFK